MESGSTPAVRNASVAAAKAKGSTRDTCLRSRFSTHANSSKSGHLAGNLHRDFRGIELGNAPDATLPAQESHLRMRVADAIRTDHAHTRNHDSSIHAHPFSVEKTIHPCRSTLRCTSAEAGVVLHCAAESILEDNMFRSHQSAFLTGYVVILVIFCAISVRTSNSACPEP